MHNIIILITTLKSYNPQINTQVLGTQKFNLQKFNDDSKKAAKGTISGDFAAASSALALVLKAFQFNMPDIKRLEVVRRVQDSWALKQKSKNRTEDVREYGLGVMLCV